MYLYIQGRAALGERSNRAGEVRLPLCPVEML
jgi:hypothetical protein